jgi:hypothetical protein
VWVGKVSHTGCSGGNLRERDHLEGIVVYGKMIFKLIIKEIAWEVMDWIDLAQDKGKWRALVNAVKNLWVS